MSRFVRGAIRDDRGQDLVEYALMAAFVAVAAGAIMPGMASAVQIVLAKADAAVRGVTYVAPEPLAAELGSAWLKTICAISAVVIMGLIVWRRHKNPKY